MDPGDVIIPALDVDTLDEAVSLVEALRDRICTFKIHNLFDSYGMDAIERIKGAGAREVWVDAKLYDTPRTIARRAAALVKCGADIISVHASGGIAMMRAARDHAPRVYGILVLSSMAEAEARVVHGRSIREQSAMLALMAAQGEVTGVVCPPSALSSVSALRALKSMAIIVPGLALEGMTVEEAVFNGATRCVLGRAFTHTRGQHVLDILDDLAVDVTVGFSRRERR
ncbi:MAG: orotidine 5'-phosphate decarboxylase / HUMPS family protein [Patescibacteria group bacterium]